MCTVESVSAVRIADLVVERRTVMLLVIVKQLHQVQVQHQVPQVQRVQVQRVQVQRVQVQQVQDQEWEEAEGVAAGIWVLPADPANQTQSLVVQSRLDLCT